MWIGSGSFVGAILVSVFISPLLCGVAALLIAGLGVMFGRRGGETTADKLWAFFFALPLVAMTGAILYVAYLVASE
jgi:hypothetical protein